MYWVHPFGGYIWEYIIQALGGRSQIRQREERMYYRQRRFGEDRCKKGKFYDI